MISKNKEWDWEITPKTTWSGTLKELIVYRNLLGRLVRKSFLVNYQQTILGPVWILLQPVLTLVTFVFVFGNLLGIYFYSSRRHFQKSIFSKVSIAYLLPMHPFFAYYGAVWIVTASFCFLLDS
jgi:ABC-type polysaccharide/polyol phosphate export permease